MQFDGSLEWKAKTTQHQVLKEMENSLWNKKYKCEFQALADFLQDQIDKIEPVMINLTDNSFFFSYFYK